MFLYNRTATVDRHRQMEATAGAVEIASIVTRITGVTINVYGTRYGQPLNTIAWSCRVDSQAHLEELTSKLMVDEEYLKWVGSNSELFETAPVDGLGVVVSSTMTAVPAKFYTTLSAQAAPGKMADAVAFGTRAQQLVADKTGLVTAFLTSVYGPFGTVMWLTGADTMAGIDALWNLQMGDADYHALVAESGPLFVAGSGHTGLIEKLN